MNETCVLVAGALCGLAGSIPPAFQFERALQLGTRVEIDIVQVTLAMAVSFALQMAALFVVYATAEDALVLFGCAMVGSFLVFWGVESLRALRAAWAAGKARGKDRE